MQKRNEFGRTIKFDILPEETKMQFLTLLNKPD